MNENAQKTFFGEILQSLSSFLKHSKCRNVLLRKDFFEINFTMLFSHIDPSKN